MNNTADSTATTEEKQDRQDCPLGSRISRMERLWPVSFHPAHPVSLYILFI